MRSPARRWNAIPIVVDGVLFATTPKLRVIALDAATGKLKWSFDPNQGHRVLSKMRNRGVTYWDGGAAGGKRIFFASRQYLYALDADTGQPDPRFWRERPHRSSPRSRARSRRKCSSPLPARP